MISVTITDGELSCTVSNQKSILFDEFMDMLKVAVSSVYSEELWNEYFIMRDL